MLTTLTATFRRALRRLHLRHTERRLCKDIRAAHQAIEHHREHANLYAGEHLPALSLELAQIRTELRATSAPPRPLLAQASHRPSLKVVA